MSCSKSPLDYGLFDGQFAERDPQQVMFEFKIRKTLTASTLLLAVSVSSVSAMPLVPATAEAAPLPAASNLAIIKGFVKDQTGSPIADATVAIFRVGTTKLLKQVRSSSDGAYLARILPGKYTVLAVAEGFNPVSLAAIDVGSASQLNYGFKLERAGSGNTLPEKKLDRNNPKWIIRSAQTSRSIYQNSEGKLPPGADKHVEISVEAPAQEEERLGRPSQTVVETYFASSERGPYSGINAATVIPLAENAEILLAGQTGLGRAPQRFETQLKIRPSELHQLRINTSFASFGGLELPTGSRVLSQISLQATDEWKVREGLIVVFGVDYSRFIGAGSDDAFSPRLGLQYDIDSKTRFRTAFTSMTEDRTWNKAIEFENAQVLFREPAAVEDIVIDSGKPVMNRSRRLEFGVERILDNSSSVEANVFFDSFFGRGVGIAGKPFDVIDQSAFQEVVGHQQGNARGLRLVYSRRLNGLFSAAAGYSFGVGQKLSADGLSNPSEFFQDDTFQSFFGQFDTVLRSGTSVRTVFKLSPHATVFAIDPFQGRLAIYDPSLSVLVTQNLPTLGLPFHAEAVVDARNLFGFSTTATGDEGTVRLNSHGRTLRGGILVRF